MPFDKNTKARMFIRCARFCCLCVKKCGTNIEAAHIIDEADGGLNHEDNGIPLCLDCHQEIGAYSDRHPRGNKFSPGELRARRDRVYGFIESGLDFPPTAECLQALVAGGRIVNASNVAAAVRHKMRLQATNYRIDTPSVAHVITAIDQLDGNDWDEAFVILVDGSFENAFVQACQEKSGFYCAEYRDGHSRRQYRSHREMSIESIKLIFLGYLRGDDSFKHAVDWHDVTHHLLKLT